MEWFTLFAQIVAVAYLIVVGCATVWFIWMTTCRPEQWLKICQAERAKSSES